MKHLLLLALLAGWAAAAEGDRDLGAVYPADKTVRVAVIGDFGYSGEDSGEAAVAKAVGELHAKKSFHLGLTVGDNFYPSGVEDTADPHWKNEFHDKFDSLGIRFYATLGNHDYAGNPQAQVDYTSKSGNRSWQMPYRYYTFAAGPARFFALDTDEGSIGLLTSKPWSEGQRNWLQQQLVRHAAARWKVVYGHHPIFSDGHHGDTGRLKKQLLPLLKSHGVDVYIAGHDHDMQHFEVDGIHFFIAGGGGKETRNVRRKRADFAESVHGFMEIEAGQSELVLRLIGVDGAVMYARTLRK